MAKENYRCRTEVERAEIGIEGLPLDSSQIISERVPRIVVGMNGIYDPSVDGPLELLPLGKYRGNIEVIAVRTKRNLGFILYQTRRRT